MLRGWIAVPLLVLAVWRTQAENTWVGHKDRTVAQEAVDAVGLYCSGNTLEDIDEEAARDALKAGVGGDNVMYEIMSEAESGSAMGDKAGEKLTPAWAAEKVAPFVVGLIILLLWPFCVLFSCPCCKCCRCGRKERKTHVIVKFLLIVALVGLCAGLLACVIQGRMGYDNGKAGFRTSACTGAMMIDQVLSGKDDPYFQGMLPALNQFYALEQKLDDGSDFMNDLNTLLDSTAGIQTAVDVASQTLSLLRDMFDLPANKLPRDGATDFLHECILCGEATGPLDDAIHALNNGVATALKDARGEVATQLGPTQRADLQGTIRSGSSALVDFKTLVRDTFRPLIDPDGFKAIEDFMNNELFAALNVLFICAFLLLTCAFCGAGCFVFLEKSGEGRNTRYCMSVHRCSCLVWQCGFLYVIVAFIIGGLINIISVPMSGMCLIMDGLSANMLRDIGPALNMADPNTLGGRMMLDMVDNCVAPANMSLNANFMDLIVTNDGGNEVTMRTQIVDQVTAPINQQFQAVADNDEPMQLANSQNILDLRAMLANNPMDKVLLPTVAMRTDPTYTALNNDDRGTATGDGQLLGLQIGFSTSCACGNHSSAELSGLPFDPLPGMEDFQELMARYGTLSTGSGCMMNIADCSGSVDVAVCNAAVAYVNLKSQIQSANVFRCDLFEMEDASTCDPKDMVLNNGVWEHDCLRSDNTFLRKEIQCDLAGFTTYIADFDTRINLVMTRLDDVTVATNDGINQGLKGLVDTHIVALIVGIVDGMNCGFLPHVYRGIIKGLCYQGIVGLRQIGMSYVASAVIIVFLMVVAYALWRRSVDNVNAAAANRNKVMDDPSEVQPVGIMPVAGGGTAIVAPPGSTVVVTTSGSAGPETMQNNLAPPQAQQDRPVTAGSVMS